MKKLLNFKLQNDFQKLNILHWCHFILVIVGLLFEAGLGNSLMGSLVKLTLVFIFYRMYFKTVKELYYTFWTLSFLLLIYLVIGIIQGMYLYSSLGLAYLYVLAIIMLAMEVYILSSPLYFPRINWWEYDFRYRNDVKITVKNQDDEYEGRLSDIRRGAGCVALFQQLKIGTTCFIKVKDDNEKDSFRFEVEVMSKRSYSVGRGYNYGVRLVLSTQDEKNAYNDFLKEWNQDRKFKKKLKFKVSKESNV